MEGKGYREEILFIKKIITDSASSFVPSQDKKEEPTINVGEIFSEAQKKHT